MSAARVSQSLILESLSDGVCAVIMSRLIVAPNAAAPYLLNFCMGSITSRYMKRQARLLKPRLHRRQSGALEPLIVVEPRRRAQKATDK